MDSSLYLLGIFSVDTTHLNAAMKSSSFAYLVQYDFNVLTTKYTSIIATVHAMGLATFVSATKFLIVDMESTQVYSSIGGKNFQK